MQPDHNAPEQETTPAPSAGGAEDPSGRPVRVGDLETALARVTSRMDGETARAAARERVIDRQHDEIERLRAAERVGTLRPVITDLGRLRNDLLRQAAGLRADMTAEQAGRLLESYAASVEDALERCGVQALPRTPGEPFTPGSHQVGSVIETDDPAADGIVAGVVRDGYVEIDGGRVVLPARVDVFRVRASAPVTDTPDPLPAPSATPVPDLGDHHREGELA